ncbi:hypothetical protein EYR40_004702 [Pleurotus pulmonarius]|nr:hypothetical protein EYR36_004144 [Pleurotus pulmonarius]KAF4605910.1 hypothetical protein EYR40_004702 [Pleurotus pulmonarius]
MIYSKLPPEEDEQTTLDTRIDFKDERDINENAGLDDKRHSPSWGLGAFMNPAALCAIICLQSIAIILLLRSPATTPQAPLYSPANEAISYKYHKFFNGFGRNVSPYQVSPSKELDERWEDLYNFGISRIPKSQAEMLPNATEAIPGDEEHYVVELDVFHQLHCLNRIRKTIYSDHYPDMHISAPGNDIHMSHCLDSIRQSLMCSSDVSLIVWRWHAEAAQSFPRGDVVHRCRDFDRIKKWALEKQLRGGLNTSIHVVNDIKTPELLY